MMTRHKITSLLVTDRDERLAGVIPDLRHQALTAAPPDGYQRDGLWAVPLAF